MKAGARAGLLALLTITTAPQAAAQPAPGLDAARYLTVRKGALPIIISAPHGGSMLLPGVAKRVNRGQRFFVTMRDQRTAELAEMLATHIQKRLGRAPHLVIARFDRRHIDANRQPEDAYTPPGGDGPKLVYDRFHKALADAAATVVRTFGRGLLLDIHGQSRFPDLVIRGTDNGVTVKSLIKRFGQQALTGPASIYGHLAARGYRIAPTGIGDDTAERVFRGGHIVRTYGSADGGPIDAIQVEIGSRHRAPEVLDRTARDLAASVAAFAKAYLPARPARLD